MTEPSSAHFLQRKTIARWDSRLRHRSVTGYGIPQLRQNLFMFISCFYPNLARACFVAEMTARRMPATGHFIDKQRPQLSRCNEQLNRFHEKFMQKPYSCRKAHVGKTNITNSFLVIKKQNEKKYFAWILSM
jgi:hypothetical protein